MFRIITGCLFQFKKEMDADAKMSEAFQPYNILPIEVAGVSDPILDLPEVLKSYCVLDNCSKKFRGIFWASLFTIIYQIKAARLAIQCTGLRFPGNFEVPHLRRPDIFDALHFAFGFQVCKGSKILLYSGQCASCND